jgi:hypothetical protein
LAKPTVALWPAQLGFWAHPAFWPVATKTGELELLALYSGDLAVVGVPAVRTSGGGGNVYNGEAKT